MLSITIHKFLKENQSNNSAALAFALKSIMDLFKISEKPDSFNDDSFLKTLELSLLNIELQMMREAVHQLISSNKTTFREHYFDHNGKINEWSFIEEFYPGFHGCGTIARSNDLSVLIDDGMPVEDSDAMHLLKDEFGGDLNSDSIHFALIETDHDIFIRAIEAYLQNPQ